MEVCNNSPALVVRAHIESIEMEALVRRFNKDKKNGKISMLEFIDELQQKML